MRRAVAASKIPTAAPTAEQALELLKQLSGIDMVLVGGQAITSGEFLAESRRCVLGRDGKSHRVEHDGRHEETE